MQKGVNFLIVPKIILVFTTNGHSLANVMQKNKKNLTLSLIILSLSLWAKEFIEPTPKKKNY